MRSSTIVFAVGLLAAPLALLSSPRETAAADPSKLADAAPADSINGRPLVDAPVPSVGPDGLAPSDRVAGAGSRALDAGPTNATPFSNTPSGTLSGGGAQISQGERTTGPRGADFTPSLAR